LDNAKNVVTEIKKDIGYYCDGYTTIEPLTIGLFGEWGSGKTHLLKGIKNRILEDEEKKLKLWENTPKDQYITIDKMIIPIFFNAWRFEKEEHIIIPLVKTMVSELEKYDYIEQYKKIQAKIKILALSLIAGLQMPSGGLDSLTKVITGEDLGLIGSFFDSAKMGKKLTELADKQDRSKQLGKILSEERIESIYLNIPQWIEKITMLDNVRFVFLIDDLDRCLPENTLKMLESIKLFLDVAGCAFVLAVDDDVVERGVEHHYRDYIQRNDNYIYINNHGEKSDEERQSCQTQKSSHLSLPITGNEYLEKMVQLPLRIPPLDSPNTREYLLTTHKELFTVQERTREGERESMDERIDEKLLEFFIRATPPTPRKIIRAVNLYEVKRDLIADLGVAVDRILVAKVTMLELFAPRLYRFIKNNDIIQIIERLNGWINMKEVQSLHESEKICAWIEKNKTPRKEYEIYKELLAIIMTLNSSRVNFDLDLIFGEIDPDLVVNYIKLIKVKKEEKKTKSSGVNKPRVVPFDLDRFYEYIMSSDSTIWRKAFSEDRAFNEDVWLDELTIGQLIAKAKVRPGIIEPKWLEIVAEYMSEDDFMTLLKELDPIRRLVDEE